MYPSNLIQQQQHQQQYLERAGNSNKIENHQYESISDLTTSQYYFDINDDQMTSGCNVNGHHFFHMQQPQPQPPPYQPSIVSSNSNLNTFHRQNNADLPYNHHSHQSQLPMAQCYNNHLLTISNRNLTANINQTFQQQMMLQTSNRTQQQQPQCFVNSLIV